LTLPNYLTKILNPTINLQLGNFNSIPIIDQGIGAGIVKIDACINLSKKDWASTETSWDFTHHPLLTHIADDKQNEVNGKLKNAFGLWQDEA